MLTISLKFTLNIVNQRHYTLIIFHLKKKDVDFQVLSPLSNTNDDFND